MSITLIVLLVYLTKAGLQDLMTRTISTWWTVTCAIIFLILHGLSGTLWLSVIGLVGMGVLTIAPGLMGWWGGGDFKLFMALGAAVGLLMAVWIVALAFMLGLPLQGAMRRISARYLASGDAALVPLGTLVAVAGALSVAAYASIPFWHHG
ncbi:MAG: prepilin peptidase [Bacilli bacterium]